jgi:ferredoxin-NADP reductase
MWHINRVRPQHHPEKNFRSGAGIVPGKKRDLLKTLPGSRSHIRYSAPKPTDRPTVDFDRVGRVGVQVFEEMGVPPDADFYICGPAAFMSGLVDGLAGWGVSPRRLHTENFGSGPSMTPGVAATSRRPPHPPAEAAEVGPLVSFTRSNLAVHWGSAFHSLLELAEACDMPVRGRAAPEFVITARRG